MGLLQSLQEGRNMAEIKDSGTRRKFDTGAVRDMSGADKGRFDLIPWEVIWDLAKHFSKGAEKYGPYNWQKGIPVDSYFDSAIRHMVKHKAGMVDEDHLTAAIWNLVCMAWEERYSPRANSVTEESNDGVKPADDGIKHKPIEKLVTKDLNACDMCGKPFDKHNKGYYFQNDGHAHKMCYECYKKV